MDINESLCKLMQTARELENLDYFMEKIDLSRTEYRLLREVLVERKRGRDIISSELARRLGVTRSAVSQIVTKLEKKNIVVRTSSDSDRKIAYIRLSDYAVEQLEQAYSQTNDILDQVIVTFGEERLQHYIAESDELFRVISQVKKESKGQRSK